MGTLIRHGEGDDAIWTYQPIGSDSDRVYEKVDTASLLLLAVEATRLIWRTSHEGVRAAQRLVLDVAQGRRPPLTNDEVFAAESRLPPSRKERDPDGHSFSIKIVTGERAINPDDARDDVAQMLHLAWNYYQERYEDAPLGDRLGCSVISLLGKIAFLLREDDRGLERLRDLEVRCLIHHWTHTRDVIPRDVIQRVIEAASLNDARERARAWRLGLEPSPFPKWTPPPPTLQELERQQAARLRAEAKRLAWETMSPEEREAVQANRIMLYGLVNRSVL
jgi:hypothetical protein